MPWRTHGAPACPATWLWMDASHHAGRGVCCCIVPHITCCPRCNVPCDLVVTAALLPLPRPPNLQAGAAEKGVPLYKHIADLAGNSKLILPVRRGRTHCFVLLVRAQTEARAAAWGGTELSCLTSKLAPGSRPCPDQVFEPSPGSVHQPPRRCPPSTSSTAACTPAMPWPSRWVPGPLRPYAFLAAKPAELCGWESPSLFSLSCACAKHCSWPGGIDCHGFGVVRACPTLHFPMLPMCVSCPCRSS